MNRTNRILAGSVVMLLLLLCVSVYTQVVAQRDKDGFLQGRNFKDGSLWVLTYVRTHSGQDLAYFNAISDVWRAQMEALKKEGIILSYKALQTNAARVEDHNVMLMVEYKDIRTWETNADKQAVIMQTIARDKAASSHVLHDDKVREFFGNGMGREIIFR
ncbi:MAG: hypothetical protein LC803_09160 [Acidobacteria bacterium]|nr:hypothetical protein [Acidobacteriota bacterium]